MDKYNVLDLIHYNWNLMEVDFFRCVLDFKFRLAVCNEIIIILSVKIDPSSLGMP